MVVKTIMKSLYSNLFVVMLFICITVKYGSCLRCYVCDDIRLAVDFGEPRYYESICEDVEYSMITTCQDSDTVCRTLRLDTPQIDGHINKRVKRSCGKLQFEEIKNLAVYGYKGKAINDYVHVSSMVCNKDLCNGAINITSKKNILIISAVLSLSFFMNIFYF